MNDIRPQVSFVIPTLNQTTRLVRCLESVCSQRGATHEVIVVSNGKLGEIAHVKEMFENVEILELGANHGFAVACNRGVRQARGLFIALINDDVILHPNWLSQMVKTMDRYPEYSSCASNILYLDRAYEEPDERKFRFLVDCQGDGYLVSGFGYKKNWGELFEFRVGAKILETFGANAAASFYRKSFFDEVGFFDESFFCFAEDVDLSFRARLRGHRCCYVPEAHAFHAVRATAVDGTDFTVYYSYRNFLTTWLKNTPRSVMLRYLPHFVIHQLIVTARVLFLPGRKAHYRALFDFIRRLPQTMKQRNVVQRSAAGSLTREALMLDSNWVRVLLDFRASRKRLEAACPCRMDDKVLTDSF